MRPHESLDNDQLVRRFLDSGDPTLFRVLFDRTAPSVVRLARHRSVPAAELDDLVQEVYFGVLTGLRRFAFSSEFETWVCAIARNKIAMRRRQRAQRQLPRASRPSEGPSLDEEVEFAESRGRLRAAVGELSEGYRSVIELRYLSGLDVREIADRLGAPESTIRTRLSRGLQQLRERVGGPLLPLLLVSLGVERLASSVGASVGVPPTGASTTKSKLLVLSGVAAAVVVGLLAFDALEPGTDLPASPRPVAVADSSATDERPELRATFPRTDRTRVVTTRTADPEEEPNGVRVVFVGLEGQRLPDLVVGIQSVPTALAEGLGAMGSGFRTVRADDRGEALIEDVPPGLVRFRFSAGDGSGNVRLEGAEEVSVTVGRAVTFEGRVIDEAGRPVGDAEVWVTQAGFETEVPHVMAERSGPDGTFHFAVAGTYARFLWAKDGAGRRSRARLLGVRAPFPEAVDLVLEPAPASVRGRVLDADGARVADALVALARADTVNRHLVYADADERGEFRFSDVLPGEYSVYVRSGTGSAVQRSVAVRDADLGLELRLDPGRRVRGLVVDAAGNPLAGAVVGVSPAPSGDEPVLPWMFWRTSHSEADGSFLIDGVRGGPAVLVAVDATLGRLCAVDDALVVESDEVVSRPSWIPNGEAERFAVSGACARFAGRFVRQLSWHLADPIESPSLARRRLRGEGLFLRDE